MNTFIKAVVGAAFTLVLLGAFVRTSGAALIPFVFLFVVLLAYVGYNAIRGDEVPYPRVTTGKFSRVVKDPIRLSSTDSCSSCTVQNGDGVRETTLTELVFLGVPLAVVGTSETVLCDVCEDPLGAEEYVDSIDRELAREMEQSEN